MADQPKQTVYSEYDGTGYTSVVTAKIAAQNDTVTMPDYTTISTVQGMTKTGIAITTTVNANIVTVTSALSNVNIILLLWGQRA